MQRHPAGLKVLSAVLTAAFLFQEAAGAAPASLAELRRDPSKFAMPQDIGLVKGARSGSEGELVLNIKDIHDNYSAQESIAGILENLATQYDATLVGMEGGFGGMDLSLLGAFPDAEAVRAAGSQLMREGRLSAAEFVAAARSGQVELYGVDDEELYRQNLTAFREALDKKKDRFARLELIEAAVERLAATVYSEDLKELKKNALLRLGNGTRFSDRWTAIRDFASRTGVSQDGLPNLQKLADCLTVEKSLDFKRINAEREALMDELARVLPQDRLERLILEGVHYRMGRVSQGAFSTYLLDQARRERMNLADYASLEAYADYMVRYESVDIELVRDEAMDLEERIREKLFRNDNERALHRLEVEAASLRDLFDVKLSSAGLRTLVQMDLASETDRFVSDLARLEQAYGGRTPEASVRSLFAEVPASMKFYELAEKRNQALLDNMIRRMRETGRTVGCLVTGGFHSRGITELMNEGRVPYVVVMPRFNRSASRPYVKILTSSTGSYREFSESAIAREAREDAVVYLFANALKKFMDRRRDLKGPELESAVEGEVKRLKRQYLQRLTAVPTPPSQPIGEHKLPPPSQSAPPASKHVIAGTSRSEQIQLAKAEHLAAMSLMTGSTPNIDGLRMMIGVSEHNPDTGDAIETIYQGTFDGKRVVEIRVRVQADGTVVTDQKVVDISQATVIENGLLSAEAISPESRGTYEQQSQWLQAMMAEHAGPVTAQDVKEMFAGVQTVISQEVAERLAADVNARASTKPSLLRRGAARVGGALRQVMTSIFGGVADSVTKLERITANGKRGKVKEGLKVGARLAARLLGQLKSNAIQSSFMALSKRYQQAGLELKGRALTRQMMKGLRITSESEAEAGSDPGHPRNQVKKAFGKVIGEARSSKGRPLSPEQQNILYDKFMAVIENGSFQSLNKEEKALFLNAMLVEARIYPHASGLVTAADLMAFNAAARDVYFGASVSDPNIRIEMVAGKGNWNGRAVSRKDGSTTVQLNMSRVDSFEKAMMVFSHELGHALFNEIHGRPGGEGMNSGQLYATEGVAQDFADYMMDHLADATRSPESGLDHGFDLYAHARRAERLRNFKSSNLLSLGSVEASEYLFSPMLMREMRNELIEAHGAETGMKMFQHFLAHGLGKVWRAESTMEEITDQYLSEGPAILNSTELTSSPRSQVGSAARSSSVAARSIGERLAGLFGMGRRQSTSTAGNRWIDRWAVPFAEEATFRGLMLGLWASADTLSGGILSIGLAVGQAFLFGAVHYRAAKAEAAARGQRLTFREYLASSRMSAHTRFGLFTGGLVLIGSALGGPVGAAAGWFTAWAVHTAVNIHHTRTSEGPQITKTSRKPVDPKLTNSVAPVVGFSYPNGLALEAGYAYRVVSGSEVASIAREGYMITDPRLEGREKRPRGQTTQKMFSKYNPSMPKASYGPGSIVIRVREDRVPTDTTGVAVSEQDVEVLTYDGAKWISQSASEYAASIGSSAKTGSFFGRIASWFGLGVKQSTVGNNEESDETSGADAAKPVIDTEIAAESDDSIEDRVKSKQERKAAYQARSEARRRLGLANAQADIAIASESTDSIISRTQPGSERGAAFSARAAAAERLALTLRPGDVVIHDGNRYTITEVDSQNSYIIYRLNDSENDSFSKTKDFARNLMPGSAREMNGAEEKDVVIAAGEIEWGVERAASTEPSAQPAPAVQPAPAAQTSAQPAAQPATAAVQTPAPALTPAPTPSSGPSTSTNQSPVSTPASSGTSASPAAQQAQSPLTPAEQAKVDEFLERIRQSIARNDGKSGEIMNELIVYLENDQGQLRKTGVEAFDAQLELAQKSREKGAETRSEADAVRAAIRSNPSLRDTLRAKLAQKRSVHAIQVKGKTVLVSRASLMAVIAEMDTKDAKAALDKMSEADLASAGTGLAAPNQDVSDSAMVTLDLGNGRTLTVLRSAVLEGWVQHDTPGLQRKYQSEQKAKKGSLALAQPVQEALDKDPSSPFVVIDGWAYSRKAVAAVYAEPLRDTKRLEQIEKESKKNETILQPSSGASKVEQAKARLLIARYAQQKAKIESKYNSKKEGKKERAAAAAAMKKAIAESKAASLDRTEIDSALDQAQKEFEASEQVDAILENELRAMGVAHLWEKAVRPALLSAGPVNDEQALKRAFDADPIGFVGRYPEIAKKIFGVQGMTSSQVRQLLLEAGKVAAFEKIEANIRSEMEKESLKPGMTPEQSAEAKARIDRAVADARKEFMQDPVDYLIDRTSLQGIVKDRTLERIRDVVRKHSPAFDDQGDPATLVGAVRKIGDLEAMRSLGFSPSSGRAEMMLIWRTQKAFVVEFVKRAAAARQMLERKQIEHLIYQARNEKQDPDMLVEIRALERQIREGTFWMGDGAPIAWTAIREAAVEGSKDPAALSAKADEMEAAQIGSRSRMAGLAIRLQQWAARLQSQKVPDASVQPNGKKSVRERIALATARLTQKVSVSVLSLTAKVLGRISGGMSRAAEAGRQKYSESFIRPVVFALTSVVLAVSGPSTAGVSSAPNAKYIACQSHVLAAQTREVVSSIDHNQETEKGRMRERHGLLDAALKPWQGVFSVQALIDEGIIDEDTGNMVEDTTGATPEARAFNDRLRIMRFAIKSRLVLWGTDQQIKDLFAEPTDGMTDSEKADLAARQAAILNEAEAELGPVREMIEKVTKELQTQTGESTVDAWKRNRDQWLEIEDRVNLEIRTALGIGPLHMTREEVRLAKKGDPEQQRRLRELNEAEKKIADTEGTRKALKELFERKYGNDATVREPGEVAELLAFVKHTARMVTGFTSGEANAAEQSVQGLKPDQLIMLDLFMMGKSAGLMAGGGKTVVYPLFHVIARKIVGSEYRGMVVAESMDGVKNFTGTKALRGKSGLNTLSDLTDVFGMKLVDGSKMQAAHDNDGLIKAMGESNTIVVIGKTERAHLMNESEKNRELRDAINKNVISLVDEVHLLATDRDAALLSTGSDKKMDKEKIGEVKEVIDEVWDKEKGWFKKEIEVKRFTTEEGYRAAVEQYKDTQDGRDKKVILEYGEQVYLSEALKKNLTEDKGSKSRVVSSTIHGLLKAGKKDTAGGWMKLEIVENGKRRTVIAPIDELGAVKETSVISDLYYQATLAIMATDYDPDLTKAQEMVRVSETSTQIATIDAIHNDFGARIMGATGTSQELEPSIEVILGTPVFNINPSKNEYSSFEVVDYGDPADRIMRAALAIRESVGGMKGANGARLRRGALVALYKNDEIVELQKILSGWGIHVNVIGPGVDQAEAERMVKSAGALNRPLTVDQNARMWTDLDAFQNELQRNQADPGVLSLWAGIRAKLDAAGYRPGQTAAETGLTVDEVQFLLEQGFYDQATVTIFGQRGMTGRDYSPRETRDGFKIGLDLYHLDIGNENTNELIFSQTTRRNRRQISDGGRYVLWSSDMEAKINDQLKDIVLPGNQRLRGDVLGRLAATRSELKARYERARSGGPAPSVEEMAFLMMAEMLEKGLDITDRSVFDAQVRSDQVLREMHEFTVTNYPAKESDLYRLGKTILFMKFMTIKKINEGGRFIVQDAMRNRWIVEPLKKMIRDIDRNENLTRFQRFLLWLPAFAKVTGPDGKTVTQFKFGGRRARLIAMLEENLRKALDRDGTEANLLLGSTDRENGQEYTRGVALNALNDAQTTFEALANSGFVMNRIVRPRKNYLKVIEAARARIKAGVWGPNEEVKSFTAAKSQAGRDYAALIELTYGVALSMADKTMVSNIGRSNYKIQEVQLAESKHQVELIAAEGSPAAGAQVRAGLSVHTQSLSLKLESNSEAVSRYQPGSSGYAMLIGDELYIVMVGEKESTRARVTDPEIIKTVKLLYQNQLPDGQRQAAVFAMEVQSGDTSAKSNKDGVTLHLTHLPAAVSERTTFAELSRITGMSPAALNAWLQGMGDGASASRPFLQGSLKEIAAQLGLPIDALIGDVGRAMRAYHASEMDPASIRALNEAAARDEFDEAGLKSLAADIKRISGFKAMKSRFDAARNALERIHGAKQDPQMASRINLWLLSIFGMLDQDLLAEAAKGKPIARWDEADWNRFFQAHPVHAYVQAYLKNSSSADNRFIAQVLEMKNPTPQDLADAFNQKYPDANIRDRAWKSFIAVALAMPTADRAVLAEAHRLMVRSMTPENSSEREHGLLEALSIAGKDSPLEARIAEELADIYLFRIERAETEAGDPKRSANNLFSYKDAVRKLKMLAEKRLLPQAKQNQAESMVGAARVQSMLDQMKSLMAPDNPVLKVLNACPDDGSAEEACFASIRDLADEIRYGAMPLVLLENGDGAAEWLQGLAERAGSREFDAYREAGTLRSAARQVGAAHFHKSRSRFALHFGSERVEDRQAAFMTGAMAEWMDASRHDTLTEFDQALLVEEASAIHDGFGAHVAQAVDALRASTLEERSRGFKKAFHAITRMVRKLNHRRLANGRSGLEVVANLDGQDKVIVHTYRIYEESRSTLEDYISEHEDVLGEEAISRLRDSDTGRRQIRRAFDPFTVRKVERIDSSVEDHGLNVSVNNGDGTITHIREKPGVWFENESRGLLDGEREELLQKVREDIRRIQKNPNDPKTELVELHNDGTLQFKDPVGARQKFRNSHETLRKIVRRAALPDYRATNPLHRKQALKSLAEGVDKALDEASSMRQNLMKSMLPGGEGRFESDKWLEKLPKGQGYRFKKGRHLTMAERRAHLDRWTDKLDYHERQHELDRQTGRKDFWTRLGLTPVQMEEREEVMTHLASIAFAQDDPHDVILQLMTYVSRRTSGPGYTRAAIQDFRLIFGRLSAKHQRLFSNRQQKLLAMDPTDPSADARFTEKEMNKIGRAFAAIEADALRSAAKLAYKDVLQKEHEVFLQSKPDGEATERRAHEIHEAVVAGSGLKFQPNPEELADTPETVRKIDEEEAKLSDAWRSERNDYLSKLRERAAKGEVPQERVDRFEQALQAVVDGGGIRARKQARHIVRQGTSFQKMVRQHRFELDTLWDETASPSIWTYADLNGGLSAAGDIAPESADKTARMVDEIDARNLEEIDAVDRAARSAGLPAGALADGRPRTLRENAVFHGSSAKDEMRFGVDGERVEKGNTAAYSYDTMERVIFFLPEDPSEVSDADLRHVLTHESKHLRSDIADEKIREGLVELMTILTFYDPAKGPDDQSPEYWQMLWNRAASRGEYEKFMDFAVKHLAPLGKERLLAAQSTGNIELLGLFSLEAAVALIERQGGADAAVTLEGESIPIDELRSNPGKYIDKDRPVLSVSPQPADDGSTVWAMTLVDGNLKGLDLRPRWTRNPHTIAGPTGHVRIDPRTDLDWSSGLQAGGAILYPLNRPGPFTPGRTAAGEGYYLARDTVTGDVLGVVGLTLSEDPGEGLRLKLFRFYPSVSTDAEPDASKIRTARDMVQILKPAVSPAQEGLPEEIRLRLISGSINARIHREVARKIQANEITDTEQLQSYLVQRSRELVALELGDDYEAGFPAMGFDLGEDGIHPFPGMVTRWGGDNYLRGDHAGPLDAGVYSIEFDLAVRRKPDGKGPSRWITTSKATHVVLGTVTPDAVRRLALAEELQRVQSAALQKTGSMEEVSRAADEFLRAHGLTDISAEHRSHPLPPSEDLRATLRPAAGGQDVPPPGDPSSALTLELTAAAISDAQRESLSQKKSGLAGKGYRPVFYSGDPASGDPSRIRPAGPDDMRAWMGDEFYRAWETGAVRWRGATDPAGLLDPRSSFIAIDPADGKVKPLPDDVVANAGAGEFLRRLRLPSDDPDRLRWHSGVYLKQDPSVQPIVPIGSPKDTYLSMSSGEKVRIVQAGVEDLEVVDLTDEKAASGGIVSPASEAPLTSAGARLVGTPSVPAVRIILLAAEAYRSEAVERGSITASEFPSASIQVFKDRTSAEKALGRDDAPRVYIDWSGSLELAPVVRQALDGVALAMLNAAYEMNRNASDSPEIGTDNRRREVADLIRRVLEMSPSNPMDIDGLLAGSEDARAGRLRINERSSEGTASALGRPEFKDLDPIGRAIVRLIPDDLVSTYGVQAVQEFVGDRQGQDLRGSRVMIDYLKRSGAGQRPIFFPMDSIYARSDSAHGGAQSAVDPSLMQMLRAIPKAQLSGLFFYASDQKTLDQGRETLESMGIAFTPDRFLRLPDSDDEDLVALLQRQYDQAVRSSNAAPVDGGSISILIPERDFSRFKSLSGTDREGNLVVLPDGVKSGLRPAPLEQFGALILSESRQAKLQGFGSRDSYGVELQDAFQRSAAYFWSMRFLADLIREIMTAVVSTGRSA